MRRPVGTATGVGRSLRLYYGDVARQARMDTAHAMLVPAGGLVFDIGAHVGDRVASFRRLGARVVAVEPQPGAMRALRLIHGRDPGVTLVEAAAGAQEGRIRLHLNRANPTVSTASTAFIAAARDAAGWQDQRWDDTVEVPVTTLDALIASSGRPDFVKIDVEGFEDAVLAGLSQPLPALSFEVTTIRREVALACLGRLSFLGDYNFALSLGEDHALEGSGWMDQRAMASQIASLPIAANSGDVYARL